MRYQFDNKHIFTPGWLFIAVILIPAGLSFLLPTQTNSTIKFFLFITICFLFFYIAKLGYRTMYANGSYLEIEGQKITLTEFGNIKWSVLASNIQEIDSKQGNYSTEADKLRTFVRLSGLNKYGSSYGSPKIGFSVVANNKPYYVKSFLQNFAAFQKELSNLNPSLNFIPTAENQANPTHTVSEILGQDFMTKNIGHFSLFKPLMYAIVVIFILLVFYMIFAIFHATK